MAREYICNIPREKPGMDTGGQYMGRISGPFKRKIHSFPTVCTFLEYNFEKKTSIFLIQRYDLQVIIFLEPNICFVTLMPIYHTFCRIV